MKIKNIMSVDLEDYYCDLPFDRWKNFENRVIKNTEKILELFERYNVNATFFVLGYVAEKFPDLIKKIDESGHEIASHGYAHLDCRKISQKKFVEDFEKAQKILTEITGKKIEGFRAPFFSINEKNLWIYKILNEKISYDSSIFPVKTQLYGIPKAPRFIYKPNLENITKIDKNGKFMEIPMATYKILPFLNLPIAGGFYLRFFPYWILKSGIQKMNKQNKPAMIYIHPKDIDADMPRIKEYNWYYYFNLKSGVKKFENLLKDFEFESAKKSLEKISH